MCFDQCNVQCQFSTVPVKRGNIFHHLQNFPLAPLHSATPRPPPLAPALDRSKHGSTFGHYRPGLPLLEFHIMALLGKYVAIPLLMAIWVDDLGYY